MEQWELLGCAACLMHGLGNQGATFLLACREHVCLFLVLPSCGCSGLGRAELGDSCDTAGTLPTLAQPVCPPDWILLCLGDPFSPPSLSICSLPRHLPALGAGTASPWGWDWEQEGQGQQQVWLGGPSLPVPCQGSTHTCSLEKNQSIQVGPVFLHLPKQHSLSTCACLS